MLKTLTKLTPVGILNRFENYLLSDYERTKKFITTVNPDVLEEISKKKALEIFNLAVKETPAYQSFLKRKKIDFLNIKSFAQFDKLIPTTDKENYIKKYSFEKRCRAGQLPKQGNIDESGGTSGAATNWIHDIGEEDNLFRAVNFEYNYVFAEGRKNYLVLSSWSTGPWATGIKFCELMEKIALVKNTSTDASDVIRTLNLFGKKRNYLLAGYPPFIKNLIDDYDQKINWKMLF